MRALFYSALSFLKRLASDELKIVKSIKDGNFFNYTLQNITKNKIDATTGYNLIKCKVSSRKEHKTGTLLKVYKIETHSAYRCRYSDYDTYPFKSAWDTLNQKIIILILLSILGYCIAYFIYREKSFISNISEKYIDVFTYQDKIKKSESYEQRLKRYQSTIFYILMLVVIGLFYYEKVHLNFYTVKYTVIALSLSIFTQYLFPKFYRYFVWNTTEDKKS